MTKKTVADYIKKYKININSLRIYDEELEDEIDDPYYIKKYYLKAVVTDCGEHNGEPLLNVAKKQ